MASVKEEKVGEQRAIRNDAAIVRKLFLDSLSCCRENGANGRVTESQLQDEFGRFNNWTANNCVFSPVLASLDTRFIDIPSFSEQLLAQLAALQSNLEELYKEITRTLTDTEQVSTLSMISPEPSPSSFYIANIIRQIHVTIDWLQRFSNLMMKEGLLSYGSRDFSQQRLTNEAGVDITDSVSARFENIVLEECPNLPAQLVWRLVTTMTIRQKNIIRRRTRRPEAPDLEQIQKDPPSTVTRVWMDPESGRAVLPQEEDHPNAMSATHDLRAESSLFQEYCKENASPYLTSWTRTHALPFKESLRPSALSRPALLEQAYICDYCHMIFSSDEALDDIGWTNHFGIDLTPYICLFDECSQPNQMFASKTDWLAHMGTQHRLKWHCVATGHDSLLFNDEESFIRHMEGTHPGVFRKDKLRFIANSSARVSLPIITDCPFCLKSGNEEDLEGHVVQHLYHFAMLSIPEPRIMVQQSQIERTHDGGVEEYNEQKLDSPMALGEALSNPDTTLRVETMLIGNKDYGWFYNPARKEQADTGGFPHTTPTISTAPSILSTSPTTSTAPSETSSRLKIDHHSNPSSKEIAKGGSRRTRAEVVTLWTCCYCNNAGNDLNSVACYNCHVQRCLNCVAYNTTVYPDRVRR